jgi:hypothetical protein
MGVGLSLLGRPNARTASMQCVCGRKRPRAYARAARRIRAGDARNERRPFRTRRTGRQRWGEAAECARVRSSESERGARASAGCLANVGLGVLLAVRDVRRCKWRESATDRATPESREYWFKDGAYDHRARRGMVILSPLVQAR